MSFVKQRSRLRVHLLMQCSNHCLLTINTKSNCPYLFGNILQLVIARQLVSCGQKRRQLFWVPHIVDDRSNINNIRYILSLCARVYRSLFLVARPNNPPTMNGWCTCDASKINIVDLSFWVAFSYMFVPGLCQSVFGYTEVCINCKQLKCTQNNRAQQMQTVGYDGAKVTSCVLFSRSRRLTL